MSNDKQPFDGLMDQSRIKGASRMISQGTLPDGVTKEIAAQVILNVRDYQTRSNTTYKHIARHVGVASF
jgi:hypothetical protein